MIQRALTVARANRDAIRTVADELIKERRLDTEAFERIIEGGRICAAK